MTTELVRWVEPGWELWELGAGRCPYCVGLGPLDFEACCDCWEFEREQARAESERSET